MDVTPPYDMVAPRAASLVFYVLFVAQLVPSLAWMISRCRSGRWGSPSKELPDTLDRIISLPSIKVSLRGFANLILLAVQVHRARLRQITADGVDQVARNLGEEARG